MASATSVQRDAVPQSHVDLEWDKTYTFTIYGLTPPLLFENDTGALFISETNGNFNNPANEKINVKIDGVNFGAHTFFKED